MLKLNYATYTVKTHRFVSSYLKNRLKNSTINTFTMLLHLQSNLQLIKHNKHINLHSIISIHKTLQLSFNRVQGALHVNSMPEMGLANSRGSWVVGRMSWVVGKKSWVVGKMSWVVGKKSWVVGKKSWVVGKKSWVVGKKSWVPRKKSWVLRKKSWVPNKKSWVPRKSRGFQAKCFRIFTFSLLECVFFVF